jgi:hypothetical protein
MDKNQIDNLIRFSFAFHRSHNDFINCDPSYIKEKWDKYIGFRPKPIDYDKNLEFMLDPSVVQWRDKWHVNDHVYIEMKDIINFIIRANEKHFYVRPMMMPAGYIKPLSPIAPKLVWIPSDLISLFEDLVGSPERINKELYNHLHTNLVWKLDTWKNEISIARDYQLCLLV